MLALFALQVPSAATATGPVDLDGAYIVDRSSVLGSRAGEVQDALDDLSADESVNLFVVYVDSFTGVDDRQAWADDTAIKNDLGVNDVLLAVATDDRLYQVSVDPEFALDDAQLSRLATTSIQPSLRENDWAGAAINTATGLGELLRGDDLSAPVITPGQETANGTGGGSTVLTWILGGAVVVVAAIVGLVFLRRRTTASAESALSAGSGPSQKDLDRQVGKLLVQLDDATASSEQELGFAIAQFGDDATATFAQTLESAKQKVRESFALKQRLDDSTPDSAEDRRAWSLRIIDLCTKADAELDAQAEAFAALRELEKNPQPALDAIATGVAAARQTAPRAASTLATLTARYAPQALATVTDNASQAEKLLSYADATARAVPDLITAGRGSEAAVSIQRSQAAVAQAGVLFSAIDTQATALQNAIASLTSAIGEASSDTAEARALLSTPSGAARSAEVSPLIAQVEAAVAQAQTSGPSDPVAALQSLQSANGPLDAALAVEREQAQRLARTQEQLSRTLAAASGTISAVKEYVVTRRGAVSVDARTRIAEAERLLTEAYGLQTTDPERALASATQANRFAQMADQSARIDVDAYSPPSSRGWPDDNGDSAALGGLLGGLFSGGGSTRRSYSGGLFGGSSGWGGSSRSSGSARSSRSSGSRRSSSSSRSGGRRGSGGRF